MGDREGASAQTQPYMQCPTKPPLKDSNRPNTNNYNRFLPLRSRRFNDGCQIAVTGLRWNANQFYAKCVFRLHWNEWRLRWLDRSLTEISQRVAGFPKSGRRFTTHTGPSTFSKAAVQRGMDAGSAAIRIGRLKRSVRAHAREISRISSNLETFF
jgi:hypothetical protein